MIVRKTKADSIGDILKIIKTSGCDEYVYGKLSKKMSGNVIIADGIDNRAANILKQESLSCGADTVVSSDVSRFKKGISRAVICATLYQLEKLALKLKQQPFGLKDLSFEIEKLIKQDNKKIIVCGKKKLVLNGRSLIMGIVNLSAESFYGDGKKDIHAAVEAACLMQEQGADIIDVGAESTRPGSKPIPAKEEIKQIQKFLKLFVKKTKLPVSVDTYKPEVARTALELGASIINDIFALSYGKSEMAKVAAEYGAGVVLMHMRGTPLTMQKNIKYNDVVLDIFEFLSERINFALKSGIKKESVIIDPGIGFAKTAEQNLMIIKNLSDFKSLGYPVLMGMSNKSFLAKITGAEELKERLPATITAGAIAVLNGADILRVHNVKETAESLKLIQAIRRA